MGELKFPSDSVIKDTELDENGNLVISVKGGGDTEKNKEKSRLAKENQEIREILFKNAKDDVGKKFLLFVYRELPMPEHGVSMTLKLKIPLETLENVDVESYIKDRVEGGNVYICHVKDASGNWPKNGSRECLRYYFEEDGVVWLKEKNNSERNKQEFPEAHERSMRHERIGRPETNILDVANVIKDAYSDASTKKEDEEKTNNQMFDLIGNLVSSVSSKPKDNSTVELLTVMTPIITELIRPRNENNHTVEALRLISESMREIGRSIADTNLKIAEKEREASESRYKDKIEMIELVRNANNNGNGGLADQAMKMLDMSNKMNSLVMTNMLGLFKNAIDMKDLMGGNKNESEEEVPVGKLILEKVLNPEMWKTGIETFNSLRGKQESEGEADGGADTTDGEEPGETEEIIEKPVRTNTVKKIVTVKNSEKREKAMKDDKKTAALLNSVVETVIANISKDVNSLVAEVLEKYKGNHTEMREVLSLDITEGAKMLKKPLLYKVTLNLSKLQKVLDGLKSKLAS